MEIAVRTKQYSNDSTDIIDENGIGQIKHFARGKLLFYKIPAGENDETVIISIRKNEVSVKRSGLVKTTMLYRPGEITSFKYNLPYGSITMEIETEKIVDDVGENGGELRLVYAVRANGEKLFNDTRIVIKAGERN